MAIYAMGLGSKATGNADPTAPFWAFLSALTPDYGNKSTVLSGFGIKSESTEDNQIRFYIGGEDEPDAAIIYDADNKRNIAIAGDGSKTYLDATAKNGYQTVAIYIDDANKDASAEVPGTPGYVKYKVVSNTAGTLPTYAEITSAVGSTKYVIVGNINQTNGLINFEKPTSITSLDTLNTTAHYTVTRPAGSSYEIYNLALVLLQSDDPDNPAVVEITMGKDKTTLPLTVDANGVAFLMPHGSRIKVTSYTCKITRWDYMYIGISNSEQ